MNAIILAIVGTIVFGISCHQLIQALLTTPADKWHRAELGRTAELLVVALILSATVTGCALEQLLP